MKNNLVLTLDQGTTSSRALLIRENGEIEAMSHYEISQFFPQQGWVEHDPNEIWSTIKRAIEDVTSDLDVSRIKAMGITNQRETTVMWNRKTGVAIGRAIVWQDRRTAGMCEQLKLQGLGEHVYKTTGLLIDAYFSATKMQWLLQNYSEAEALARRGELSLGTIDSWLIRKLTGDEQHSTDVSNASRTMLFDIHKLQWDEVMLKACNIPLNALAKVRPSIGYYGKVILAGHEIPISGVAGDQQAALFGQRCFSRGMVKNTYGTGCFMLMNTGAQAPMSSNGLLSTIAWSDKQSVTYALEGSVFIAGAAVQWLRDGMQMIESAADSEQYARQAEEKEQVYVVPAFAGLGAPYWDMYARGAIFGLTRDTGKEEIIRATLESMAYQTRDVLDAMVQDAGIEIHSLLVDGGASANDFLMQFQSDILQRIVIRPKNIEATALGVAWMAGIGIGLWTQEDLAKMYIPDKAFRPIMEKQVSEKRYLGWQKAVKRTMHWVDDEP